MISLKQQETCLRQYGRALSEKGAHTLKACGCVGHLSEDCIAATLCQAAPQGSAAARAEAGLQCLRYRAGAACASATLRVALVARQAGRVPLHQSKGTHEELLAVQHNVYTGPWT